MKRKHLPQGTLTGFCTTCLKVFIVLNILYHTLMFSLPGWPLLDCAAADLFPTVYAVKYNGFWNPNVDLELVLSYKKITNNFLHNPTEFHKGELFFSSIFSDIATFENLQFFLDQSLQKLRGTTKLNRTQLVGLHEFVSEWLSQMLSTQFSSSVFTASSAHQYVSYSKIPTTSH